MPRPDDHLVPIEDLTTRSILWHGVWDWIIGECERLASLGETPADEVPEDTDKLASSRL